MRSGAFAQVERRKLPDGSDFALKTVLRSVLPGRGPSGDAALCAADAAREASLLRRVVHVNIVRCVDSLLEPPPCSLTLEWCDTDVARLLRSGPLRLAAAKALFEDLLRGLAACAEKGLLHLVRRGLLAHRL